MSTKKLTTAAINAIKALRREIEMNGSIGRAAVLLEIETALACYESGNDDVASHALSRADSIAYNFVEWVDDEGSVTVPSGEA